MMRREAWSAALAVLLVLSLAGACKKRSPGLDETGMGEEGLGSSLERAKSGISPEEDGVLKDVHFAFDSYALDGRARDVLARNVAWLRSNGGAIEVEGHCDDRGTVEYNLALGARRAGAVKEFLLGQGVTADRIKTITYGEELPICGSENESCWARNRRAHFAVRG